MPRNIIRWFIWIGLYLVTVRRYIKILAVTDIPSIVSSRLARLYKSWQNCYRNTIWWMSISMFCAIWHLSIHRRKKKIYWPNVPYFFNLFIHLTQPLFWSILSILTQSIHFGLFFKHFLAWSPLDKVLVVEKLKRPSVIQFMCSSYVYWNPHKLILLIRNHKITSEMTVYH